MKSSVDLNCDMGEGYGQWVLGDAPDDDIMSIISSANVAAGFHAGDPNSIERIASLANDHGVGYGAHPGYFDLQGFGRRYIDANNEELINDITYQIGAVREFGRRHGISLQHVKLHGALYMEAAKNADLSGRYVNLLKKIAPEAMLYCMGGSETERAAQSAGYKVIREFYADRHYGDSGSIVFTRNVGQLSPEAVAEKCIRACEDGTVETVEGNIISIEFESICFHSDTSGALEIGKAIREALDKNGIQVLPPSQSSK